MCIRDSGDMFGIKEFFNYVNKKNSSTNSEIKDLKKRRAGREKGTVECDNPETELVACKEKLETAKKQLFKPIFGCEMYVACLLYTSPWRTIPCSITMYILGEIRR